MIRVVLVDDHPVVRAGLAAVLHPNGDIEICGEAATAAEALTVIQSTKPDVILMDLNLGDGTDGARATQLIRRLPNPPRVLVLTTYEDDANIVRAVDAGATGYLLKDAHPAELARAIRATARGETVLAAPVASRLLNRVTGSNAALTPRELEIITELARGGSNRDIARRLSVSEATVKSHLVQIFSKLGVDSRTKAVLEAQKRGLLA